MHREKGNETLSKSIMAKVIGILGLISSIIGLAEAAYKVYKSASDAHKLPKRLRTTAEQLPLVVGILQLAGHNVRSQQIDQQTLQNVRSILERCEQQLSDIKTILEDIIPTPDASWAERSMKAMGLARKSQKVKRHMAEIMQNTELLANLQVFSNADVLHQIHDAVEEHPNLPDEEERSQLVHSGAGSINTNTGVDTQQNYANSGSGSQYNANTQNFGRGRGTTSV